jgi:hypothetical protein
MCKNSPNLVTLVCSMFLEINHVKQENAFC